MTAINPNANINVKNGNNNLLIDAKVNAIQDSTFGDSKSIFKQGISPSQCLYLL